MNTAVHAVPEFECSHLRLWPERRGVCEALVPSEGCLGIAAGVSTRALWVSSTSSTFPAANPCAVDARAGLATSQQGFPVSAQETVKMC